MKYGNIFRRLRAWGAWIALTAVVFNAALPLVSLAKPVSDATIVLCTAHGIQIVAIDPESGLPGESQQPRGAHCPFCAGGGTPLVTATQLPSDVTGLATRSERPLYAERPLGSGGVLTAASPRGPPAHA